MLVSFLREQPELDRRVWQQRGPCSSQACVILFDVWECRWKRGRELGKEHGRRPMNNGVSHVPAYPAPPAPAFPVENGIEVLLLGCWSWSIYAAMC